jgi:geranylgeranyl diphosphate synthase type I
MTTTEDIDIAALIADTEGEIVRLVQDRDPSTHGLYEMVRYHLALDGSGASGGKRMRPLLGLLAYASITGEHERALPGAAAVELGHNFSLVHDDIEDGDVERRYPMVREWVRSVDLAGGIVVVTPWPEDE